MNKYISITLLVMFPILNNLLAQTYAVTGVQENDTLNVRVQPHYKSNKIGELSHDAFGIIVNECEGKWCNIQYLDMDGIVYHGWVSKRYLKKKVEVVKSSRSLNLKDLGIVDSSIVSEKEIMKPFVTTYDKGYVDSDYERSTLLLGVTPDGRYMISVSHYNATIKIWDVEKRRLVRVIQRSNTDIDPIICMTSDGKHLFDYDGDKIDLWNIETGKNIHRFKKKDGKFYTPDGEHFLSFSSNKSMYISKIKTGETLYKLKTLGDVVTTPDKKYTFFVNDDTIIEVEDTKSKKTIYKFVDSQIPFELFEKVGNANISLSENENFSLYLSDDSVEDGSDLMYLLNLQENATGKTVQRFKWSPYAMVGINPSLTYAITKNEKFIVIAGARYIKKYDLDTGKEVLSFGKEYEPATTVALSPDGRYLLTAWSHDNMKIWDFKTGKKIGEFKNNDEEIMDDISIPNFCTSIVFSSDGKYIASADTFGNILVWDFHSAKVVQNLKSHKDRVLSLSFTNDGKTLLSSSADKSIKLWNLDTGELEKTFHETNGVNKSIFTSDEKHILSMSEDGMVRLWNRETGKEVMSMVSFSDGEWVAITPEGYFNASKNGAKHLNVLTGPMSVTSVDAYYETFYRPDIVKAALAGKKIETGLAMSDIKPAPQVEIINTPSQIKSDEVKITLNIKDIGGGIGDIRLYLNGVAVKTDTRAITRKQSSKTIQKSYTLKLPSGKNTLKALVFNQTNTMQSNDALHTITAEYKTIHKPELHALVIGIDTFKNPKLQLKYAASDATLFAETIKTQSKGIFSQTIIHTLNTKENTSKEAITQKLKELQSLNPEDLFVFYVASHGTVDDGEYFLITSNVGSTSTRKLKTDAIKQEDLKRLIANVPTTKKLIVLDTCNAGAMGEALLTRGMSEDTAIKILSRAVGSTILSAATSQQQALEGHKGHGLFTYVLTEGLKGKADSNNDGYVKTLELANYIDDEVPQLAEKLYNRAQYPVVSPTGQGFPVGKVK